MKLSAAERQWQLRAQQDVNPVRKAEKEKYRNRWHKRRNAGQTSRVINLGEREQRYKHRYWREVQYRRRARRQKPVEMTVPHHPSINASDKTSFN